MPLPFTRLMSATKHTSVSLFPVRPGAELPVLAPTGRMLVPASAQVLRIASQGQSAAAPVQL